MKHVMFDFETLAVSMVPAMGSIGLAEFDPFRVQSLDEIKQWDCRIYYNDISEAIRAGCKVDQGTLKFWMTKHKDLASPALIGPDFETWDLASYARAIFGFMTSHGAHNVTDVRMWCKGSDFDGAMLKWIMEYAKIHQFPYNCIRDVRTVFELAYGTTKPSYPDEIKDLKPHNPMDDCHIQIYLLQRALYKLHRSGEWYGSN
jgi:hypothetical protein